MTFAEIKKGLSPEEVISAIERKCGTAFACDTCPVRKECHARTDYEIKELEKGGMSEDESELWIDAVIAGALAGIDLLTIHQTGTEDSGFTYQFSVDGQKFNCNQVNRENYTLTDDAGFLVSYGKLFDVFTDARKWAAMQKPMRG